jgi:hypothetical protein
MTRQSLAEFAEAITSSAATILDDPQVDTPQLVAEGSRYLTRLIAGGAVVAMESWDAAYPRLVKMLSPTIQYGLPAADCCYLYAAVHGDHTYRITGTIGTSRLFDAETWAGHPAYVADWRLSGKRSEFDTGPDGRIDILLSREEQPGNWVELPDGAGCLMLRQYYYDWETETPARLVIQRVGAELPPPPTQPRVIEERVRILTDFVTIVSTTCAKAVQQHYAADPSTLSFDGLDFGFASLKYGRGHYECEPDQAVIIETTPPDCRYWGIQLVNHFWEALDWDLRQTSINGHQAVLDTDGRFRAVIAHRDPGVHNWLDPAGHPVGLIAARYYEPPAIPELTIRTVAFDDLPDHLPANTSRVSPTERQDSLRRRMLSVPRRLCD